MAYNAPTSDDIREIMMRSKTVAVVGVSNKEERASHQVARYLVDNSHFKLFFVNPAIDSLFGEKVYPSLLDIPEKIDLVDIFRKAEDCMPVLDEAISIGAKTIWLQLGITSDEIASKASAAGLDVVMDRCLKVDYASLTQRG